MVTVTVYGYGRILYGQCTVTARHRTSPYHVGQLALLVMVIRTVIIRFITGTGSYELSYNLLQIYYLLY